MSALLLVVVSLVLLGLGTWLLVRHIHDWTAWEAPVVRVSGRVTQTRRCKDTRCNRHQIKDVRR